MRGASRARRGYSWPVTLLPVVRRRALVRIAWPFLGAAVLALLVTSARPASACTGLDCLNIYASGPSGPLLVQWDFDGRPVQTFLAVCVAGECTYSGIDPGFRTGEAPAPADAAVVADGTRVGIEVVDVDPAVRFRISGRTLAAGDTADLGSIPDLHVHPTWQLRVAEGEIGTWNLSFRLTTSSASYEASPVYRILITNIAPPTPTVTPTATPTPTVPVSACPGDCDGDGQVAIAELIRGVAAALGGALDCQAMDGDGDGLVAIAELVAAVNAALSGCPSGATPTPTEPATFAAIRDEIFVPRCALPTCHDAASAAGGLRLTADTAYDDLVGVEPQVEVVRDAGVLRVDPGAPDNSFLITKLISPPLGQGSRMPAIGDPLTDDEVALIRAWIDAGAAR